MIVVFVKWKHSSQTQFPSSLYPEAMFVVLQSSGCHVGQARIQGITVYPETPISSTTWQCLPSQMILFVAPLSLNCF